MEKKEILFSVIVPVYNAEQYLRECIQSILVQTEQDFELILVNDGSTDSSKDICKKFVLSSEKIRYFEIPNSGVSVARNVGIENAVGEYLLFCDSDDYWSPKLLERLKTYAQDGKYDIINFGHVVDKYENGKLIASYTRGIPNNFEIKRQDWENIFRYYWNSDIGKLPAWEKAFKRSMVIDRNCRYKPGQTILEDFNFVINCWDSAETILILNDFLYHFRCNVENSGVMRRSKENLYHDVDCTIQSFLEFLQKQSLTQDSFPELNEYIFGSYGMVLERIKHGRADKKTVIQILKELFSNQVYLKYAEDLMGKRIKTLKLLCDMRLYKMAAWYMEHIY